MANRNYSYSFKVDAENVKNNLKLLRKKNQEALRDVANDFCQRRVIPYMKKNAPWKDRTGNARRTLNAKATLNGKIIKGVQIELSHGVWYGYRLETWFNQRYQIIWPTVRALGPELLLYCNGYLNKIRL